MRDLVELAYEPPKPIDPSIGAEVARRMKGDPQARALVQSYLRAFQPGAVLRYLAWPALVTGLGLSFGGMTSAPYVVLAGGLVLGVAGLAMNLVTMARHMAQWRARREVVLAEVIAERATGRGVTPRR